MGGGREVPGEQPDYCPSRSRGDRTISDQSRIVGIRTNSFDHVHHGKAHPVQRVQSRTLPLSLSGGGYKAGAPW